MNGLLKYENFEYKRLNKTDSITFDVILLNSAFDQLNNSDSFNKYVDSLIKKLSFTLRLFNAKRDQYIDSNNYIYYSNDGKNWNKAKFNDSIDVVSKLDDNLYVAYDIYNNYIYYSNDSIKWNKVELDDNIYAVTKLDNNLYVAYNSNSSNSNYIYYSNNGKDWNKVELDDKIYTVSKLDNNLYAAYRSGYNYIYLSNNGIDWNKVELDEYITTISKLDDNVYVAYNNNGGNYIYYSNNGIDWNIRVMLDNDIKIVYKLDDNLYVACNSGTYGYSCISDYFYYSNNGKEWTKVELDDDIRIGSKIEWTKVELNDNFRTRTVSKSWDDLYVAYHSVCTKCTHKSLDKISINISFINNDFVLDLLTKSEYKWLDFYNFLVSYPGEISNQIQFTDYSELCSCFSSELYKIDIKTLKEQNINS